MAFLRPVLPEAMKSAYVASTSDIARASFTQQHLQEEAAGGSTPSVGVGAGGKKMNVAFKNYPNCVCIYAGVERHYDVN